MSISFVAFDVETAAPQRASTCSIGYAVVTDGTIVESGSQLVNPGIEDAQWGRMNMAIHGIRPTNVRQAQSFRQVWLSTVGRFPGVPLVAHNASFDMGVLRAEHARQPLPSPNYSYACSMQIARRLWWEAGSAGLANVCDHLGIEVIHHEAESDARASAMIVCRAAIETNAATLAQLLERLGLSEGYVESADVWKACGSARTGRDLVASSEIDPDPNSPFCGKRIAFTGGLSSMVRHAAERLVLNRGGFPQSSVNSKTDFVVIGGYSEIPNNLPHALLSNKHRSALRLLDDGAPLVLLTEGEFLGLL